MWCVVSCILKEKENFKKRKKMPGLIGVIEFVDETREDYSSPTTSNFVYRMPQCRQTISSLEEVRICIVIF